MTGNTFSGSNCFPLHLGGIQAVVFLWMVSTFHRCVLYFLSPMIYPPFFLQSGASCPLPPADKPETVYFFTDGTNPLWLPDLMPGWPTVYLEMFIGIGKLGELDAFAHMNSLYKSLEYIFCPCFC